MNSDEGFLLGVLSLFESGYQAAQAAGMAVLGAVILRDQLRVRRFYQGRA
jgi:hypothetical protein